MKRHFFLSNLILISAVSILSCQKDSDVDEIVKENGSENGYEYVDLGLSVKWATCNIGATKPEGYGNYYAWGETETKNVYFWSNYKYCNGSFDKLTKYCFDQDYGNNGFTDNLNKLELSDDVAHVKWGGNWRMPTIDEFWELKDNCTWTWTTMNGVVGYKVNSKKSGFTSCYIFLPAAGYRDDTDLCEEGEQGEYWSSSLYGDRLFVPHNAVYIELKSRGAYETSSARIYGRSVRPVCP